MHINLKSDKYVKFSALPSTFSLSGCIKCLMIQCKQPHKKETNTDKRKSGINITSSDIETFAKLQTVITQAVGNG